MLYHLHIKLFLLWKVSDLICPLPGGDPGGVDWPPLEHSQPKKYDTWKNKRKYVGPKNFVKPTSLTM